MTQIKVKLTLAMAHNLTIVMTQIKVNLIMAMIQIKVHLTIVMTHIKLTLTIYMPNITEYLTIRSKNSHERFYFTKVTNNTSIIHRGYFIINNDVRIIVINL